MKRRIVAALDGTTRAADVLAWAIAQAGPDDEVVALNVWNLSLIGSLENPFADLNHAQLLATERIVALVKELRGDTAVRIDVRHGVPADELLEAAADADLLVLGKSVHSALGEFGSVSRTVVRKAPCTVALVPSEREKTAAAH